jgi:hypothetical protein
VAAELAPTILADTTAVPGDTVIADCISCENPAVANVRFTSEA